MRQITIGLVLAVAGLACSPAAFAQRVQRDMVLLAGSGSFLGVGVAEITPERARDLKLKEERGVEVTRVSDQSPAEKAGLRVQDVVLEYNGQRVEGIEQFSRLVRETPAGREATILVSRDGQTQTLKATIASRVARLGELGPIRMPDTPGALMSWRSPMVGIEAESLTPQLAGFFGVKEGVLVRSVSSASPAEKAGMRAGDVIVRVDGKSVASPSDVTRGLRSAGENKTVPLTIVREKREMEINLVVDSPWRPRGEFVTFHEPGL